MQALQIISQDLFDKVRSRFSNLEMGNEDGATTIDPTEARFFDFDFVVEKVNVGRVSISLNDAGSLKLYYSQGITEGQDDPIKKLWFNFLKEMRRFAKRRMLRFDTRDIAKTNLDKNDFQYLASKKSKEEQDMTTMNETKKIMTPFKKQSMAEGSTPGYIKYEQMKDKIASVLIKLYDQGKDEETIKQMGARVAKHLGYDPEDSIFQDAWLTSFTDAELDGSLDSNDGDDYTDYSMRQGELGNPNRMTDIREGRWNHKSTKKTSRAVKGKTEVIVRHKNNVNEMLPSDRSRAKNINVIFIQNADGERFKSPFNYLPLAFAIAQHIDHGGVPYDDAAKKIISMCEEIAQLQEFRKHVKSPTLHSEALGIADRAFARLQELKMQLESLGKRRNYESWIAEFNEQEVMDDDIAELSPVQMEEYKSKFTEVNFNEELAKYFPLIHNLMREPNTVNIEEFVKEGSGSTIGCSSCGEQFAAKGRTSGFSHCKDHSDETAIQETSLRNSESLQFEAWADSVEQGTLNDDQLEKLAEVLPTLTLGPNGTVAWNTLAEILELDETDDDDVDLKTGLEDAAEEQDIDTDGVVIDTFQSWVKLKHPEWEESLAELFPPETPAEPAAPEAPVAEEQDDEHAPDSGKSITKEVAEIVKRFYNSANESVGPFSSEERICLEVEKSIGEKYGEQHSQRAGLVARKFMEKLTHKWEQNHHKSIDELAPEADEGMSEISRLKELVGNIKAKVEGIGDRGTSGEDFNNNIMSAEDGPDKSQIPAAMRKEKGGDWRMTLKDLEAEKNKSPTTPAGLAQKKKEAGINESALEAIIRLSKHKT